MNCLTLAKKGELPRDEKTLAQDNLSHKLYLRSGLLLASLAIKLVFPACIFLPARRNTLPLCRSGISEVAEAAAGAGKADLGVTHPGLEAGSAGGNTGPTSFVGLFSSPQALILISR